MDEKVRKAMSAAKRLESHPVASDSEIERIYRDGMERAERLRDMLRPAWYVNAPRRKVYKSGDVTKTRR